MNLTRAFENGIVGFLAAVIALVSVLPSAHAELVIDVNKPNPQPMPIAITRFLGSDRFGQDIAQVVSADLERSGLFRPIDPNAFPQQPEAIGTQPRFEDWKLINAQALVNGRAEATADGQISVEFRLWDVLAGQMKEGQRLSSTTAGWRRIAHKISDMIYHAITSESGYFDTQIVFIAESGPATRRTKQLAIMDQDGFGYKVLTPPDPKQMILTPRFSPSSREIAYMSYFNDKQPRVYLFDIDSGRQEMLGDFPGMTFAPRFSPDGNRVVMSLAINGASQIYTMDLRTRERRQLTSTTAIDTSPSYSPDGKKITFNSDRGGSPQIYVMNADGSGVQRISFGPGRYYTPVWSPRGDLIAFTKQEGDNFSIGILRPDGKAERILDQSFLSEGPTWAPNGRVLMFFRQGRSDSAGRGGGPHLYSVDITGRNLREIVTPSEASDPAWSPLIP
jgi:TolB protein